MHHDLPAYPEHFGGHVCIGVAGKQCGLEEDHARVPDGGGAAEQRQDHLCEHGLDRKNEGGGDEEGDSEQYQHPGSDHRHLGA